MSEPRYAVIVHHDPTGNPTVVVQCPYCPKTHTHGWPPGEADLPPESRHRSSHCVKRHPDDAGYFLVEPSEVPS